MSEAFQRIDTSGPVETDGPAADRLIAGNPVFTTWNVEERDGLYCGTWRSTPGETYRLQFSDTLKPGSWQDVSGTDILATGFMTSETDHMSSHQ